ncbi:MAG: hypothetical protein MJ193_03700, partial [Clostridia bacterium]|nr:hypothetical protein [Clostridia bacterium]
DAHFEELKQLRTIFCWECQDYARMSYRMISRLIPGLDPSRVCRFLKDPKKFNIHDEQSNYYILMNGAKGDQKSDPEFSRLSYSIHQELMKIVHK